MSRPARAVSPGLEAAASRWRMVLPIGAMLVAASTIAAQQRDSTRGDTAERPFVRGGVYDKPFLTRLSGRAAIGGYAEAHVRHERADGFLEAGGFEAKRFNLFVNARVSDFVRFAAEVEFEDGGREVTVEFAAIDLRIHPALSLRGGMLLSPLGRFNLSHDSPLNEFTDRPLMSTELLGVALSEPGIGVYGQVRAGARGRVTYELYATNGFSDGLIRNSGAGTRIALGRRNFVDNHGSPAVVGRVAWSPRVGFELGLSAHHGAYNRFESEGVSLEPRRNLSIRVVDAEVTVQGVRLQGELAFADIDIPVSLAGIYASRQQGIFVEAVRDFGRGWIGTMPGSSFAAKLRVDVVDFDAAVPGNSRAQVTIGVNFRPTQDTALKFDFVRGVARDEFNNASQRAAVLLSLATYF